LENTLAKKISKKNLKRTKAIKLVPFSIYFDKNNYFLLALGVGIIVIGYVFMAMGPWYSTQSLDVSPVLLIIGYLVVLPVAILYKRNPKEDNGEVKETLENK